MSFIGPSATAKMFMKPPSSSRGAAPRSPDNTWPPRSRYCIQSTSCSHLPACQQPLHQVRDERAFFHRRPFCRGVDHLALLLDQRQDVLVNRPLPDDVVG